MDSKLNSNSALQEVLDRLEGDRKKIASTYIHCWILVGLAIAILGIGYYLIPNLLILIIGVLAPLIGAIVLNFQVHTLAVNYKSVFKTDVVASVLKNINKSLIISPLSGLSENEFMNTALFIKEPDRYKSEDMIRGTADKTFFWFSEVHAEYKTETHTKNGTRTEWHTIFKGIIFVADFNKNFSVSTIVRPMSLGDSIGSWFSKNIFDINSKELVQLENTDFDNTFVTYSRNQIEARYILTPSMMERILELNNKSDETISLSFVDSKMYIAFPLTTNYFEPPIYTSLLTPDLLEDDISIVTFMQDIVSELDLNTRIWGKD